eukprot:c22422_g1_i4 orf=290-1312(-)
MSWKGNFVSKFGQFLPHSADKSLYKGEAQDQLHGLQHYSFTNTGKAVLSNGRYGTETPSVTSFLLAILSSSNAKYPRCRHNPEAPEEVPYISNSNPTLELWEHHGDKKEQDPDTCRRFFGEGLQGSKHEYESNDPIIITNGVKECPSDLAFQPNWSTPSKLPPFLSEESSLLHEDFQAFIALALPTIAKDRHWILLYSTAKHGTSMRTLYQRSSALSEPFLLVIGDLEGAVFGGLATAPLKPTAQRKYSGNSDTFVFTNLHEEPQLFKATGANRYYVLCTKDAISFGGGGHFALHLDDTLLTGSSGTCDTFGNDCLAASMDFSVSNVEVWGFAHATRHHA